MASSYKAPKQWVLPSDASVTQFEAWKNNLLFTLSLDSINSEFLKDSSTWLKESSVVVNRGLLNDPETVDEAKRLTAAQKCHALQIMLGQIANYAPINRATIVKHSTSLKSVWKAIRLHLGFQANGARVLDLAEMTLKPGERAEDLYQRLLAFIDDNLMKTDGGIKHQNEDVTQNEELCPSLENYIVVIWLKSLHPDLPKLVKQRYSTQLRMQSLASIKDDISGALDSLLEEINANQESRALRSVVRTSGRSNFNPRGSERGNRQPRSNFKNCPLCKQAGRSSNHFLTECQFLPEKDKAYFSSLKARAGNIESEDDLEEGPIGEDVSVRTVEILPSTRTVARRVPVLPSPFIDCFYKHYKVRVTVDSGATGSFIRLDVAQKIHANIRKHSQQSNLADGHSRLDVVGETTVTVTFHHHSLVLEALVATSLDEEVLGGIPFMARNDVWVRPKKKILGIGDTIYEYKTEQPVSLSNNRVKADLIRLSESVTVLPGDYLEVDVPHDYASKDVGIEPRVDTPLNRSCSFNDTWPPPQVLSCVENKLRIPNLTNLPKRIQKHEHFCQILHVTVTSPKNSIDIPSTNSVVVQHSSLEFKNVAIDPDNITPTEDRQGLESLIEEYSLVFNTDLPKYNGKDGAVKSVVNMGPVQPPQRKGRLPLYNRDKLDLLQEKFDELENLGVFAKPEDVGICVEYLNPSFLITKSRGGHRLVTDFGEVANYAKPQPSLMSNMEATLRAIAHWNHIICTDLYKAYFQIPLDRASMKYCGVSTPYKGTRVYLTAAMGQPGSETALEELTCRVFGSQIQSGHVAKIADNIYCGGSTLNELHSNFEDLLRAVSRNNLRLSASQTIVNPKSTTILGWVWSQGTLKASPHSICSLQACKLPETVTQLRSFIGAYKILSRVIPGCASSIAPLDKLTGNRPSSEKIKWSDSMRTDFENAQKYLSKATIIHMPIRTDKLWIHLDATTKIPAVGATLFTERNPETFKVGGFFSAKLKSHQIGWLPCEREALSIASAIKYFQQFIIQSDHKTVVLTDSKPCVQAFAKAQRGEFSASPRVSTFLSICHRFQVSLQHIAGVNNALSDFQSRNPAECDDKSCQICKFISETENSVVREITVEDVINGQCKIPFLSRSAWKSTQFECPDLRRTHAHLQQGTRPSKRQTNISDIRRYLNSEITIASDGLLVVRNEKPSSHVRERIVIPRLVLEGLLTSLHLKLAHPTLNQLKLIAHRYYFALDMDACISNTTSSCHTCTSLMQLKHHRVPQSTSDPPPVVGSQFAADVLRRERQFIFVLREIITSYTWANIIESEDAKALREALIRLCIPIRPIEGPTSVIRVDSAPGFKALCHDKDLKYHKIVLDFGRVKNINKNPVAERGIQELEGELLRDAPRGGAISALSLSVSLSRLNSRLRSNGLSSREMLFQRDQFNCDQLPISDLELITKQHQRKLSNHVSSEKSKAPGKSYQAESNIVIGDLVYLSNDLNKLHARDRYIVTGSDDKWVYVRKFVGNQLREASYKVKRSECIKVIPTSTNTICDESTSLGNESDEEGVPNSSVNELNLANPANLQNESLPTVDSSPQIIDTSTEIISPQLDSEDDFNVIHEIATPTDENTLRSQRQRKPVDRLQINWREKSYT